MGTNFEEVVEDCQQICFHRFKHKCDYKVEIVKDGESAYFALTSSFKTQHENIVEGIELDAKIEKMSKEKNDRVSIV